MCRSPFNWIGQLLNFKSDFKEKSGDFDFPLFLCQVLLNMIDFGMDPQQALDKPRFCIHTKGQETGLVFLEEGISSDVATKLKRLGHEIKFPVCGHERSVFGRGQIIARKLAPCKNELDMAVYWTGSDPRADGMAIGL